MLTALRDGTHSKILKLVLFGLLLMGAFGMVLMDVGGFFRGGMGSTTIAKAGREKINYVAFDRSVQRILQQQGMSARDAYQFGFMDQILQAEIADRVLTQAAAKMGLMVSDDVVAKHINSIIDPAAKQQGVDRKVIFDRVLQSQGMSEQMFVSTLRRSLMNSLLQTTVMTAAAAPSRQEAAALYSYQNETRDIDALIMPNSSVKDVQEAPDDVLKAFYEAGKSAKYSIPETRSFVIAVLDESNIKGKMQISDEDLKKEYDRSIKSFTAPERRTVQQAVLTTQDEADKVIAAAKEGKNLKDAVKYVTGKDAAYTGEQIYEQNGLVKDIADAAFGAESGQVLGPIKTPLGLHVLVVTKITPPETESFDKVKESIRKELASSRLSEELYSTSNAIDDRLAAGENIEDIAKDMGLKVQTIGPVRNDGSTPDDHDAMKEMEKDRAYILKSVFEMNEGETAPVMELSGGRYAAVRVDKVTPLSFRPYEDVKKEIAAGWLDEQRASVNRERMQKAQQAIESGEKTLGQIATELGGKTQNFNGLKRKGDAPKALGPEAVQSLFEGVKGESVMAEVPDGYMIGVVRDVAMPDPSQIAEKDLKALMDSTSRSQQEEFMQVYMQQLQKKIGVKVNRHLLDMLYGPESGNPPG